MNLASLPSQLRPVPVEGTWFRAVARAYMLDPLGFAHTPTVPSRYNAGKGQYPLLYLAPDELTALLEYRALVPKQLGILPPGSARSVLIFRVEVRLRTVIDLGDPETRSLMPRALRTMQASPLVQASPTVQGLTGDWQEYQRSRAEGSWPAVRSVASTAPTQKLGAALASVHQASGLKWEAFLAPSAVRPQCCNLVVFPDRLIMSRDPLKIESPDPRKTNRSDS